MRNIYASYGDRPSEYLRSVDLALLLLNRLRDTGEVRISQAAKDFGVSQSTVHRSMAMLIYRGFATTSPSHSYLAGPAMNTLTLTPRYGRKLFEIARPRMQLIATETGETCHLCITKGKKTHFIATIEGTKSLRVSARLGHVMPSELCSGGQASLARFSATELRSLYRDMPENKFNDLRRRLQRTRDRGFAVNNQLVESEVSALGTTLHNDLGDTLGAISISVPTSRFKEMSGIAAEALLRHTREINRQLDDYEPESGDPSENYPLEP